MPEDAALSRTRIARLIADGAVCRDGAPLTDLRAAVAEGEVIEIRIGAPAEADLRAEPMALSIVYEDESLIVVDKPAGMVVHPAPGSPSGTLVNALMAHCGDSLSGIGGVQRPGIVHRIDKDTSGLLVVAKTDRAHHGLAAQFARHDVHRHYRAVVHGCPDAGDPRLRGLSGVGFEGAGVMRVATLIGRHRSDRQRQAVLASGGRAAVTRARVLDTFGDPPGAALVDCWLETGRTHQIRVHMAYAGHALVGDPVYGRGRGPGRGLETAAAAAIATFGRQALHAATLGFCHSLDDRWMEFESPLPADMAELIRLLGKASPGTG